jgi:hypothetical protein
MSETESVTHEDETFMDILCQNPVLLEKSQVPSVKEKKTVAFGLLQDELYRHTGKRPEFKALAKKIANMKTYLRKKTDVNRTGNRSIKLTKNEERLAQLLEIERNPVFKKIEGMTFYLKYLLMLHKQFVFIL